MKQVASILICLIVFSCALQKESLSISPIEVEELANSFTDTLIESGVDTILVFTKGCSGCIKGVKKSVYVYWKQRETSKIRKYDSYTGVGSDNVIDDLVIYFYKHHNEIRQQELKEPEYILSHYNYTGIRLIINGKEFYKSEISEHLFNNLNDEKRLIIWIQKIESIIFNLERRY
ncbi:MAG: hypothetical protein ACK5XN_07140 [Bacteroidota bacterium]